MGRLSLENIEPYLPRICGVIMVLLLISLSLWNPPLLNDLRLKSFDALIRHFPAPKGSSPVVIVDIDTESLTQQGQWPWPRNLIATLVNNITEASPAVIGFDIVFAEPDRTSPRYFIKNSNLTDAPPTLSEYLKKLPDHDLQLAKALYYSPAPVIIGHAFTNDERPTDKTTPKNGNFAFLGEDPTPFLFSFDRVDANLKMFEKTAQGSGFFNILPDYDGIVRNEPALISFNDKVFPSLVLAMLQQASKTETIIVETDLNGVKAVKVGPHRIPTDGGSRFIVNFSGPARTFLYLSANDILTKTFDPQLLKDAYILIGTSAPGLFDIRAVPTDQVFPGVEVHANALNTILSDHYLLRPEWAQGAEVVYLLLTGLLMILLLPKLNATRGAILAFLLAGGMTSYSLWNFRYNHLQIDMIYPLITTSLLYTFMTFLNYLAEEKKARHVRTTFSQYLSPTLVEELVENQQSLALGGEERELTILFSDIRGFTSFSEKMSPQALCAFLNEYLTPMTTAVMDQRGTVDKFIGDAIMAFWNAPLTSEKHIEQACHCAIEMVNALEKLNASQAEQNFPVIKIGIGIHSGMARVGNMGSLQRFDYTVMGDTVNLCSRLEGLTKMYGVTILVSETVHDKMKNNDLYFRKVDRVRVKGKNEPVTVYELLGFTSQIAEDANKRQLYDKALTSYEKGDFSTATTIFTTLVKNYPEDKLLRVYRNRCQLFAAEPPEQWDGITNMTSK